MLVFSALGIARFEERFSSNYPPDDHYFLGFGVNASIEVCDADEERATDFPYWVTIRGPVSWGNAVDTVSTDPTEVASMLQRAGMQSKLGLA
ncbi:hypothetical protein [Variovorax paradoxus]|uniref:hypothetical protein n=1 Tax=Variovorax paradoxus TaxID=34073 RepID=UPI002783759A|nr:hypothetical protein [Variovorax paradoxus]MDQ0586094.1 hypothetical protein [Variovorax paradoxus]